MLLAVFGALVAMYAFLELADDVLRNESMTIDAVSASVLGQMRSPLLDSAALALSFAGSEGIWIVGAVLLGVLVWQRRAGAAVTLLLVAVGAQLLNDLLKTIFHRVRPTPLLGLIAAQQYSFPSGHGMESAAFYGFVAYLAWRLFEGWTRWLAVAALALLVLLIGWSRIYLQAHYLSDVLAGYLAGLIWLDALIVASQLLVSRRTLRG